MRAVLAALLLLFSSRIFASCSPSSGLPTTCTTAGEAYAAVGSNPPSQATIDGLFASNVRPGSARIIKTTAQSQYRWVCVNKNGTQETNCGGYANYSTNNCPGSGVTQDLMLTGKGEPNVPNVVNTCYNGCGYSSGLTITLADGDGGVFNTLGEFKGTATACSAPNPISGSQFEPQGVAGEACVPQGSLTQCWDAQTNKSCVISPKGNKYCWSPGETGPKVAVDETESVTRDAYPTVSAPPSGLTNAETVTSTTTNNTGGSPTETTENTTLANQTGTVPAGTGGSGSGDGSGAVVTAVNATTGAVNNVNSTLTNALGSGGAGDDGDTSNPTTASLWSTLGGEGIDQSGLGFGTMLPPLPTITIRGVTYTIPYQDKLADLAAVIRLLVIAAAMIWAVGIIRGSA